MKPVNIAKLSISLVLCLGAGIVGSFFTTSDSLNNWYANLVKPSFTPPAWLFGPVWTILYILMAVALFLIWRKGWDKSPVRVPMLFFLIQLIFNVLWTPLFFLLQSPLLALFDIIILLLAILLTIVALWRVSKPSALLLIPYFCWVSFAAILNTSIYFLNRS